MSELELEVEDEDAGHRLDVVIARRLPGVSRARAKGMIERGDVRIRGRRVHKGRRVAPGERIEILALPLPVDFYCAPDQELEIEVLLETRDFVIVAKPAGIPSHPLEAGELGTLTGALVARYPEMRDVGYSKREPGIVHRLDTGTSGVMVAARNHAAFASLRAMLRAGAIEKRYLARCVGDVDAPRRIEIPLANDPRDHRKVRACVDAREIRRLRAHAACTEILKSAPAPKGSLVTVRANHARRHQIRVHLASIGHPLLGDVLYGGPALEHTRHHLLHAHSIRVGDIYVEAPWDRFGP